MELSKRKYLYFIILALALTVACVFVCQSATNDVAYAGDAFQVVFPSAGYFQSSHPTLIAANERYMLVYDASESRLYARSNETPGTVFYDVQTDEEVLSLYAVGDKAFFVTESKFFALDLASSVPTIFEIVLPTPDDVTYITTDGTYLYAKSAFGYITIYDDDFNVALSQDNVRNVALTGNSVVLGNADTLYIFTTTYGFPHYTILNLSTGETEEISTTSSVQAASVGDDTTIFALVGGVITCIDKTNGESVLTTEIAPDAFSSFGNTLFTIEGDSVKVYTLSQDKTSLDLTASLNMVGKDLSHLNAPLDVVKVGAKYAIADSYNNRIAYYENGTELSSTYDMSASPYALAADGNVLYIAVEGQILKLSGVYVEQRYEIEGVKDILYLDKLYALKDDGVYCLVSGEFVQLFDVAAPIALASAEEGTNVFILTEDEVVVIDKDGNRLPFNLTGNFIGAQSLAVDYAGNVVIAYAEKVEVFENNVTSLNFKSTTELKGDVRATLNSCLLTGDTLYFTASESYVGKLTLDVATIDDYNQVIVPTKINAEAYEFRRASNQATAYTLPLTKRNEALSLAPSSVLMTSENSLAPQDFLLAYDGKNLFYIPKDEFETVDLDELSGEYVATKETTLFELPNVESDGNVTIDEGTHVVFEHSTAGFMTGNWVIVKYDSKTYFATQADFAEYVPPAPERKTTYGRAKGTRVGGIVNVYQSADTESVVILEIADGTKLEILDETGDFYQVKIGETIGYMSKSDVELGALTSVQIVSIVLAIAVLLAGSTIFVAIYMTKKKQANE